MNPAGPSSLGPHGLASPSAAGQPVQPFRLGLVLGGASSGKSERAEKLAASLAGLLCVQLAIPVTYLATGAGLDSDPELLARVDLAQIEMAQIEMARIERHRSRRPAEWATVEVNDPGRLATDLADCSGVALVDSLGAWLAAWSNFDATIGQLVGIISNRRWPTIVVSEEVGLSVHPPTESGRRFVERLGVANQTLAAAADRVELVVAGVPLVLKEAR